MSDNLPPFKSFSWKLCHYLNYRQIIFNSVVTLNSSKKIPLVLIISALWKNNGSESIKTVPLRYTFLTEILLDASDCHLWGFIKITLLRRTKITQFLVELKKKLIGIRSFEFSEHLVRLTS